MIFLLKTTYRTIVTDAAPCLIATDKESWDALSKLPDDVTLTVETKRARNPDHHRKFFALLQIAFENQQTDFPTLEAMLDAIKIEMGHAELRKKLSGETYWAPKSISFHSMGQDRFAEFYNQALDLICLHIIPGMSREALENELRNVA